MIDNDEPTPYHGVAELRSNDPESPVPALSASEARQVSGEDPVETIARRLDVADPKWKQLFAKTHERYRHESAALFGTELYARRFAEERHGSQRYGEHPYVVHLWAVRQVLTDFDYHGGPLASAAWLHDLIEDTSTTREEIAERFGEEVAALVWAVTGVGKNREERNRSVYEKIRQHRRAATLKLADRVANVEASQAHPDKLAMYRKEHAAFEEALGGLGEAPMWERLRRALGTNADQARGQRKAPSLKPIYDDVFAKGVQWVESLAHAPEADDEPSAGDVAEAVERAR